MMKKVILICLLSLSVCLSKPDGPAVAGAAEPSPKVDTKAVTTKPQEQPAPTTVTAANTPAAAPPNSSASPNPPTPAPASIGSTVAPVIPSSTTKTDTNNTNGRTESHTVTPKDTNNGKASTETADTHNVVKNETNTNKDKPVTPKADVTTKPTEVPKHEALQARGFDGPSFIGGIILTLGLLAIGFMGFKYYKNQTERNYHTL